MSLVRWSGSLPYTFTPVARGTISKTIQWRKDPAIPSMKSFHPLPHPRELSSCQRCWKESFKKWLPPLSSSPSPFFLSVAGGVSSFGWYWVADNKGWPVVWSDYHSARWGPRPWGRSQSPDSGRVSCIVCCSAGGGGECVCVCVCVAVLMSGWWCHSVYCSVWVYVCFPECVNMYLWKCVFVFEGQSAFARAVTMGFPYRGGPNPSSERHLEVWKMKQPLLTAYWH